MQWAPSRRHEKYKRDALEAARGRREQVSAPERLSRDANAESLLAEIRDTLKRIEASMKK